MSGLLILECSPVLGLVPWLEPSETVQFGTIWRLSLSRWTPLVHVELDRKQFFSIELDFK